MLQTPLLKLRGVYYGAALDQLVPGRLDRALSFLHASGRNRQLLESLDPEANSIGIIVKHLCGNMRSRWSDFLTSDGEKPDRRRDDEFLDPPENREAPLALWNEGWACLFGALESLAEEDITRIVTIRGEPHSVMQAVNRQVAHY